MPSAYLINLGARFLLRALSKLVGQLIDAGKDHRPNPVLGHI